MSQVDLSTPALKSSAGKILLVDDEANVLSGFRRTLGRKWNLTTASSGAAALELLKSEGPFAVIITDMQMPEMNGVEFLERVHASHKDVICMMLTGNADQETAAQAINRGHVFRFLNKPCAPEAIEGAVAQAVRQHELVTAERVLLKDTLTGAVRVLTEAMGYTYPKLTTITTGVRKNAQTLGDAIGLGSDWRLHLSSMLCLIGYTVLHHVDESTMMEEDALQECAASGARLVAFIPRLQPVSKIVRRQREREGLPPVIRPAHAEECESVCTQLVRWAVDIERVKSGHLALDKLLEDVRSDRSPVAETLTPHILDLASQEMPDAASAPERWKVFSVALNNLREGMVVDQEVVSTDGRVLLARGFVLTTVTIERLKSFARAKKMCQEIQVRAPADPSLIAA